MSQITVKVRASSWGKLFDCAYAWEGTHLLGMNKPSGLRAVLGTSLHASTAVFDTQRMAGGLGISVDDAAGVFVDHLRRPKGETDLRDEKLTVNEAERIGLTLHTKYCLDVSPRYDFAAVELETKPLDIDCGNGVVITLTGTLDRSRLVTGTDGVRIADLKSGARAVEKGVANIKGHAPQIGTYELLYEHSTGVPITGAAEIIGLKTSGKPEIRIGEITGAKARMVGTAETPGYIELASRMFRAGLFPPNPQSQLCAEKYCARWNRCTYHA